MPQRTRRQGRRPHISPNAGMTGV